MSALPAHAYTYAPRTAASQIPQQPPAKDEPAAGPDEWSPSADSMAPAALVYARPSRPRRGAPPRVLLIAGAGVAVAALIAGGVVALSGVGTGKKKDTPSAEGARLAGQVFALDPAATTDGRDQRLNGVTAVGSTVVAVGGESDTLGARAQFFVSTDGGSTFRLGTVRTPQGDEASYGDTPKVVAGSGRAWVAIGSRQGGPAVWTSKDGTAWIRQPDTAGWAFTQADRVHRVARTSTGFIAVGDTSAKGDYSDARPVVWLSGDGSRWERLADQQLPMSVTSGSLSLIELAAQGNTVIVHAFGATTGGHPGSVDAVWQSSDGGRHWDQASTPKETPTSLGIALAATPSGFLLARNTVSGGRHFATVLQSADGRQWSRTGEIRLPGYTAFMRFGGSERGLVALVSADHKVLLARSTDGRSWTSAGEVAQPSGRELLDATATAGTTVVVGAEPGHGDGNAVLAVRNAQGQEVPIDLAHVAGAAPPDQLVQGLATGGGRMVAVGSGNGDAAIWTSVDGRQWSRAPRPQGLTSPGLRRLVNIISGPSGWLAVGYDGVPNGQPLVVTSQDGSSWKRDASFKPSGDGRLLPFAAAAGSAGYVIVGEDSYSAAIWYSADLKTWQRGKGVRPQDITGAAGASHWMHAVTAGAFGYVAVGGLNDPTIRNAPSGRPAVWTSGDGKAWALQQLPVPDGCVEASFSQVAAKGNTVVATGTAATQNGWAAFAEVSDDGGKSWQPVRLPSPAAGSIVTAFTVTPTGLLIAGSSGRVGRTSVVLWTSREGHSWNSLRPQGTGLSGNAENWLSAVATTGNRLVAAGVTADHLGERPTLWQRPLP
jgi:hypothetical protein